MRALAPAAALALLATLAPVAASAIDGSATVTGGGTVVYTNAESATWVDGDLLLKFTTNSTSLAAGSFTLPGVSHVRILAIGGGGGGGGAYRSGSNGLSGYYGGGGGGGAGGFVEVTNFYSAATYSVVVGGGGAGGLVGSTHKAGEYNGNSGNPTTITTNGVVFINALGGGGGANEAVGIGGENLFASGGGGSMYRQTASAHPSRAGGVGTGGQGCSGGKGDAGTFGGGGGGAGGSGGDASTANPTGGVGRVSNITGSDAWYAGGGGGGHSDRSISGATERIAGGKGGGGGGGVGTDLKPTAGEECTGGGGGGTFANTSNAEGGAAGGSGVVYVRISIAIDGNLDPPEATVTKTYKGEAQQSVDESFAYTISGDYIATTAGVYVATVTLKDGFEWSDHTSEPKTVTMTINKAQVGFLELWQKNWMFGTPDAAIPSPHCVLTNNYDGTEVTYSYGPDGGPYVAERPTDVGSYKLRAEVAETANQLGVVEYRDFSIINGLGSQFTDYVEITIDPYTGVDPPELTNFPYKITLSEDSPFGFLYSRTGKTAGEELAFTDAAGNVLPYAATNWNTSGTSVLYVRVPLIGGTPISIYLYWHLREGQSAPEYTPGDVWSDWSLDDAEKATSPGHAFDLVVRDGYKVEYWKIKPKMTLTMWDRTDPVKGELNPEGELADGAAFVRTIINSQTGETLATLPQTDIGAYRIIFRLADPVEYEPFEYTIDFCITGDQPFDGLTKEGPSPTLNGRVMLANDDYDGSTPANLKVTDQSYWQERVVDGVTNEVFWVHEGGHSASIFFMPSILPGSSHMLCQSADGTSTNAIWRLVDVLFGNTYESESDADGGKNFLPCSATQHSTVSKTGPMGTKTGSGNMMLRNKVGAAVYSPCYTNGIGTIYFDAVNGWNGNIDATEGGNYRFVVELATETTDGKVPTDENSYGVNGWGNYTWDGNLPDDVWKPCPMLPLKRDGTPGFTACDLTYTNSLDVVNGGTSSNFYRICVGVDCRKPCRFRIRRVSTDSGFVEDGNAFILLDNIVVSYPRPLLTVEPYGWYDHSKSGKYVLGHEAAMTVPFPKIGEKDVHGRAKASGDASAITNVDVTTFLLLSRMHYRWRYLNQKVGAWMQVDLPPTSAEYVSAEPLSLPDEPGDVEYFFESFTTLPYYEYHDYSGTGLRLGGLYSESQKVITNTWRNTDADAPSTVPTGGRDWFFRMREGASDLERVVVVVNGLEQDMELIGDGIWRCLVKVSDIAATGEVPFYFELKDRQTAGATYFAKNTEQWYPEHSVTNVPGRGQAGHFAGGKKVLVDEVSGYLEFQLNERSGLFSVGHAEYQTFNGWHDARNDLFLGTFVQPRGANTLKMKETDAGMNSWPLPTFVNSNWNLPFELDNYLDTGFPKGEFFVSHLMPGNTAWSGELGQFVDAYLTANTTDAREHGSGIAWQMRGKSLGKVTYDMNYGPSGLDTVSFKARLAQSVDFGEFTVWAGDGSRTKNDYTFLFPAVMSIDGGNDYSPGAAMSIIGYYRAGRGCYEFRVDRLGNDGLQLSIYKWVVLDGEMTCECIASQWYPNATLQHNNSKVNTDYVQGSGSTPKIPYVYGMFISLGEDGGATRIIAGISKDKYSPAETFTVARQHFMVCCEDNTSTRLKNGSVGVLTTDCKGLFLTPRLWSSPIACDSAITEKTTSTDIQKKYPLFKYYTLPKDAKGNMYYTSITFRGTSTDMGGTIPEDDGDEWNCTWGRTTPVTYYGAGTAKYHGFEPPQDLAQTVDLCLKGRGKEEDWVVYTNLTFSSFGWEGKSVVVRTNADVSVQLRAGPRTSDVAVRDISQTGWNGEDINRIAQRDNEFIYTQAKIEEKVYDGAGSSKVTNRYARLQPARAVSSRPLSIRGPIVHGVGMVGFSYDNVDPACEILVQVATNEVVDHLYGSGNYNDSLLEVKDGEQEPFGYWVTMTNFTAAALGSSGTKEFHFGWHDSTDSPLTGVMRIVVKAKVVDAAHAVVHTAPEHGSITITKMWVHDEPPIDKKSWIGWNVRTLGGGTDTEGRMYLPDMTEAGLSAALNNSTTADVKDNPEGYKLQNPAIQSPTFEGDTCIGQVRFRARLYTNNVSSCRISLWGAQDGSAKNWTYVTTFTNTATTYCEHEFSAIGDRYKAIRLAVDGVIEASAENPDPQRVLIDEIVVSEKAQASLAFAYARPFRNYLNEDVTVPDILDRAEQPLLDESWGVQAKLRVGEFDTDIDVDRGFRVTFRYYVGRPPSGLWGYANWKDAPRASVEVELKQVGDPSNLVFRSTVARPASVVPALRADESSPDRNVVVQYMLTAKYYLKGGSVEQSEDIAWSDSDGWSNPPWYEPVDLNKENGGAFSPYTILEEIPPGRAWINEVNYNDGPKAQNGGSASLTNQFVELAVPRGYDMTGWKLNMTDMNHRSLTLAVLGKNGRPATKTAYGEPSGDYDFYVLQSPETRDAGGLRDAATGLVVADATWDKSDLSSTLKQGTLQYDEPYQFELVRPSGAVEHQFVLGGTNEWWGSAYEIFAPDFDATNLLAELDAEDPSDKRFYAGDELARMAADGATFSSLGVSGAAHGEEGGWSADMRFSPGRANDGQDELTGWMIRPNGGSCWVYATIAGDAISQRIGADTSRSALVVVTSGTSTNIEYTIAPWYQMAALTVNGVTNAPATGAKGSYTLSLLNITSTTEVVAYEGISSELTDVGLDPADPYTPAVMRWLSAGVANGNPFKNPLGPISLANWKGLCESSSVTNLSLKEMYWYDIDPTEGGWWMRGGTTDINGIPVYRKRAWNSVLTSYYTNRQIRVKLYFSNDVSKAVYAPYRLQGLGGEQSDSYTGSWTSETFKVEVFLNNGLPENKGFMPFRLFVFGPDSFEPKGSAKGEYSSLIEILDPFSESSPGYSYGWTDFAGCSLWFKWKIDEKRQAMSVETLDKDSSYNKPPYEEWTP